MTNEKEGHELKENKGDIMEDWMEEKCCNYFLISKKEQI